MYELIARYVYGSLWAIRPDKLAVILEALRYRRAGGVFTPDEIRARVGAGREQPQPYRAAMTGAGAGAGGAVQVLPVYGTIAHRADLLMESSGGTSTANLGQQLRQALADPGVAAIVLDVDSPGGAVDGVPELAEAIYQARGQKPVVAVANSLAASAAYWLASAATELFVSPSGEVGSIGVYAAHEDHSGELEQEGVKVTLVRAGKYKAEGNPWEPLSDEARAYLQERIDDYYGMFVAAVARGRAVKAADVRGGFGEGRVVGAKQAVAEGMADRVGTLDDAIARAAQLARKAGKGGNRADDLTLRLRMVGL